MVTAQEEPFVSQTEEKALESVFGGDATGMVCDIETGICAPAGSVPEAESAAGAEDSPFQPVTFRPIKKVDVYYVTDPICSHCWALEPTLRRFTEEYGRHLEVKTVMGGLLPQWNGFADRANGIGGPSDVAGHWREVGETSRMPIDGSVWNRDPLASSYPPSRVYLVIRERDAETARLFLRKAREAVFAFDRNIASSKVLVDLVNQVGLDGQAIVAESESERGEELLRADIALARELGVRGFPTLVFVDDSGQGVKVGGVRGLDSYAKALENLIGEEPRRSEVAPLREVLEREGRLFAKEIETLYDVEQGAVEAFVAERLPEGSFERGEVLGETYWAKPQRVSVAG